MASANGLTLDLDDLPALIAALRRVALPDMRPPPKTDGGAISNPRPNPRPERGARVEVLADAGQHNNTGGARRELRP